MNWQTFKDALFQNDAKLPVIMNRSIRYLKGKKGEEKRSGLFSMLTKKRVINSLYIKREVQPNLVDTLPLNGV